MPSMPSVGAATPAPSQEDPATAQAMADAENVRKRQIMNMQGRNSTIGTSQLGDTQQASGYKVSLLGGQ